MFALIPSLCLLTALWAGLPLAQPETAPKKVPAQGQPPAPAQPSKTVEVAKPGNVNITTADELLDVLETADADLQTLTADIQYDKVDGITGDRQTRQGKLFFRSDAPAEQGERAKRTFSVRFDSLRLGTRLENEQQLFIFDGMWLIEVRPSYKQIIKRQVTQPGSAFDPLKIGEGPLPLPIGQKKADMLARFDVTLLSDVQGLSGEEQEETDRLHRFVKGAYQLRLVPREGTPEAEKFGEIRLWYRAGDTAEGQRRLLPRMARTLAPKSGNIAIVQMINVKTNAPIEPAMFSDGAGAAEQGWDVVVEALTPITPQGTPQGEMQIEVLPAK
jgi:hypothetical protein